MLTTLAAWILLADGQANNQAPVFPIRPEFLVLILLALYFIVLRPQSRERKSRTALLEGLKKNDRVVTYSGIKGTVASIHRDRSEVVLTIDKATKAQMTITLDSISKLDTDDSKKSGETKKDPEPTATS